MKAEKNKLQMTQGILEDLTKQIVEARPLSTASPMQFVAFFNEGNINILCRNRAADDLIKAWRSRDFLCYKCGLDEDGNTFFVFVTEDFAWNNELKIRYDSEFAEEEFAGSRFGSSFFD